MDRWDGLGAVGSGLVAVGIYRLMGDAWVWIWFGALILGLYVLREVRLRGGQS